MFLLLSACIPGSLLLSASLPQSSVSTPLISILHFTPLCCPTSITTIANQSYQVCRQALQTRSIHDSILLPKVTAQSIESRRRKKRIMKGLELQGHAVNLKSKIIYRCYQTVSRRDRDRLDEVEWHELLSIFLVWVQAEAQRASSALGGRKGGRISLLSRIDP